MQTVSLCKHILRKAPAPLAHRIWVFNPRITTSKSLCTKGGGEGALGPSKNMGPKKRSSRILGNSTSFVQVLGNGTDTGDTCPSVLLFFEQQRFVFNVGEGFQRYCFQHKIKLGKVKHFFLTRMSTEACGGVPGLLLTLTEHGIGGVCSGTGGITLHGPRNTHMLLNAMKTFIPLGGGELSMSNFGEMQSDQPGEFLAPLVDEPNVKIQPLYLQPELVNKHTVPQSDSDGEGLSDGRRKKAKVEKGASTRPHVKDVPAACYLCCLSENKGKFHPEKAKALGIKPGPAYSELQNGQSVTNNDGIEVHSHQVMSASTPGPVLIIVDCPDSQYTSLLCQAPGFSPWLDRELEDGQALVLIHLGPANVVSSNLYTQWVGRFPRGTDHMFVNLETCQSSAVLRKSAVVQTKLNFVDDHIFPLPAVLSLPTSLKSSTWEGEGYILGKDLLKYWLKPIGKKGVDGNEVLEPFSISKVKEDFEANCSEATTAIQEYKELINTKQTSATQLQKVAADELEVTFLGTGSAVPSKYRNVTCIYLDFFAKGSMILDCGEGSYGQLIRRFGIQGAKDALRKLKCVWISHIHADHHAGLARFLSARQKALGNDWTPVLVIGPPALRKTLLEFAKLEPISYNYLISNSVATMNESGGPIKMGTTKVGDKRQYGPPKECLDAFHAVKQDLGLTAFDSFYVKHCSNAFGVKLESKNWKVVFTGDAMPCNSVIKAAQNATLLIHEATFEQDMIEEALRKRHSTTKDALEVSLKTKSQYTILTHFSQRYPKVPVLTESSDVSSRVGIAFDLMSVNLAELDRLPSVVRPCMFLFEEEAAEADEADEAVLAE